MEQTGGTRLYVSPPLTPGARYAYKVRAHWRNGDRDMEQVRDVSVRAGDRVVVVFPKAADGDEPPAPRPLPQLDQP